VSTTQTVLLGAIAGLTIFLGLPVGRLHTSGTAAERSSTGTDKACAESAVAGVGEGGLVRSVRLRRG
jgi:hypothetical protein